MTHDELENAYRRLLIVGWPGNGTGPWVDAMDLELRTKFPADHQLLIVGFGLGRSHEPRPGHPTDGPDHAAWRALLVSVVKRTRIDAARIDLGYGRPIRPASVVPGYAGERRSRKRR